jgi:hypothetical protein
MHFMKNSDVLEFLSFELTRINSGARWLKDSRTAVKVG